MYCLPELKLILLVLKLKTKAIETYTMAKATLQQVLQNHPATIRSFENTHVQKVLNRLQVCRTAKLGYHAYQCTS